MIELRLLRSNKTTTKPGRLQYRTFDRVEGWTHSNWTGWKEIPTVLETDLQEDVDDGKPPEPKSITQMSTGSDPSGLATKHVDLDGFLRGWLEP